jgi:hypothetical protein
MDLSPGTTRFNRSSKKTNKRRYWVCK